MHNSSGADTASLPSANARIIAVLFDADGVLQQSESGWRGDLAALCPQPARSEQFLAEVFAAERPGLAGRGNFRDALEQVLRRWNIAAEVDAVLQLWWQITPYPAMFSLLQGLRRRGMTVAIASNQHAQRARYMSAQLGYASAFDRTFYSCDVGYAKPDPAYFEQIVQRLGAAPDQLLFVDDLPDNVAAAQSVGLHAEVFRAEEGAAAMAQLLRRYGVPA